MRIVQLIDSLEAGGAERMAVNYANALADTIAFSGLVATRKEGPLVEELDVTVPYLFLKRKNTFDFGALFRLRNFVKKNQVSLVHAHGTSFFIAVLLKLIHPKIKLIWHDHYGNRVRQHKTDNFIIIFLSVFFSGIFVVNHQLEAWAKEKLIVKKVFFIPNFATFGNNYKKVIFLKGENEKRIVCLANLKKPKNHQIILNVFKALKLFELGWSLHLIGRDYKDEYSKSLNSFITENKFENSIYIYDSQNDIQHILSQASIAILSSTDEGFPVALIEYGLARLAVVSTNVGFCSEIIINNKTGLLFDPLNEIQFQNQLLKLISNKDLRLSLGVSFHQFICNNFSKDKVIQLLLSKYKEI